MNKAVVKFYPRFLGDEEEESREDLVVEGDVIVNFERDFVVLAQETDDYQVVQTFLPKHFVREIELSMNKKNSAIVTPMTKEEPDA